MVKIILISLLLSTTIFHADAKKIKAKKSKNPIAILDTTMGEIKIELLKNSAPLTVKNFIELATGKKGERGKFYDGIIFHRVIPNFMIQTGDPTGTGSGGPGYKFADEINADSLGLNKIKVKDSKFAARVHPKFSNKSVKELYESQGYHYITTIKSKPARKGSVAMANSGPDSNGSQFFINEVDTPWLDGKHTVFGKVIKGMDVVKKIANVKQGPNNKPIKPIKIKNVKIINK